MTQVTGSGIAHRVKDGAQGVQGNNAIIYRAESSAETIVIHSDNSFTPTSLAVNLYKYTGDNKASFSGYTRYYYSTDGTNFIKKIEDANYSYNYFTFSPNPNYLGYKAVKIEFYLESTFTTLLASKTINLVGDGAQGSIGRMPYPAGNYDTNVTYTRDATKCPFVFDGNAHYYLNADTSKGIKPSTDTTNTWLPFNMLKWVFTEVLFSDFGKLASAIFSGVYMMSQQGRTGAGVDTSAYQNFNGDFSAASNFIPNLLFNFLTGEIRANSGYIGLMQIIKGALIGRDTSGKERIRFTADPVPDLASLTNSWESVLDSFGDSIEYAVGTDMNGDANFDGTPTGTATNVVQALSNSFTLENACYVKILGVNHGASIVPDSILRVGSSSVTVQLYNVNTSTYITSNLDGTTLFPAGTYSVFLRGTVTLTSFGSKSTLYDITQYVGFEQLEVQKPSERTFIGSNGFYSMFGAESYIYFKQGVGLVGKGPTNMPGVLASGSVSSVGTQSNVWGAKASAFSVSKAGTGFFNVPHNIGSANYTANVTCNTADCVAYIASKTANYLQVAVRRNGAYYDCGFDYTIIGSN